LFFGFAAHFFEKKITAIFLSFHRIKFLPSEKIIVFFGHPEGKDSFGTDVRLRPEPVLMEEFDY
jgi:hypothetical protein